MDAFRRMIFPGWGRRGSRAAGTPSPATAAIDLPSEQLPLQPVRPRLALPPIVQRGASIPPQVGERAYYSTASLGCMAWEINGTKTVCHFSAPASFYPTPTACFVGVVATVDGVCHHVTGHHPFSAGITDDDHQPPHG